MIDPLRWGSVNLGGLFLDGERALMPHALPAGGEASGGNGEFTEFDAHEEVEKIFDVSQTTTTQRYIGVQSHLRRLVHHPLSWTRRALTWVERRR